MKAISTFRIIINKFNIIRMMNIIDNYELWKKNKEK